MFNLKPHSLSPLSSSLQQQCIGTHHDALESCLLCFLLYGIAGKGFPSEGIYIDNVLNLMQVFST